MATMLFVVSTVLLFYVEAASGSCGKNFSMPCELAKELYWHDLSCKEKLPDWLCIVNAASEGRTNTVHGNKYGLFQIPCPEWCHQGRRGGKCKMKCEDLLDEKIEDDVECVKKMFHKLNCFCYWEIWRKNCKGKELPCLDQCLE